MRGDNEVVKVDVRGHGPQLQAHSLERCHPERLQVLKIVRVIDLMRLPDSLGRRQRMWRETNKMVSAGEEGNKLRLGSGIVAKPDFSFKTVACLKIITTPLCHVYTLFPKCRQSLRFSEKVLILLHP